MAGILDPGMLEQGGGGLFGSLFAPIANNRNAILGYLAGALQGGSLGESIGRGLQGWMGGSQLDTQRQGQNAALQYVARAPDIEAALRTVLIQNPPLAGAFLKSRLRPGTSSDIAEYEYAKRQGFAGTLADWIASARK